MSDFADVKFDFESGGSGESTIPELSLIHI